MLFLFILMIKKNLKLKLRSTKFLNIMSRIVAQLELFEYDTHNIEIGSFY